MNLMESFQSALHNVKANKMRSFLTMLGIIIGISSVITIVSIGTGGKNYITGELQDLGTNVINLQMKSQDGVQSRDYFTLEDVEAIKSKIPEVTAVEANMQGFGSVSVDGKSKRSSIGAVNLDYMKIARTTMISGRFLNERDIEARKSVIIIDDSIAAKFFKGVDPIDKKITLNVNNNSLTLKIVGVMKNPNGSLASAFGDNMPGTVLIPITIGGQILTNTNIGGLSVLLSDMSNSSSVASGMVSMLEKRHKVTDKYAAVEGFKELDTLNNILSTFTAVIGAIAGISLIVGGIGVMNIMLVSVTERTREIGIRKAIGARRKDIRIQFLTESLIICLIGGTIGMLLGIGLGALVGKFIHVTASVSIGVIATAVLFSSAVGIFFGLYPANKAAKLDPIDALRYE